jgi:beta-lactamase superfamily II metal-dependent hydrolase
MLNINFLPAFNGDCILITTDKFNILIDGGMSRTYNRILRDKLEELEQIDLVILTHIDEDHIAGLIELFKDEEIRLKVKKVWFNSLAKLGELFNGKYDIDKEYSTDDDSDKNISYRQGESLESLLDEIDYELIYLEKEKKYQFKDIELTILSPRKKDLKRLHKYWLKDIEDRKKIEVDKNINDTVEEYESIEILYKKKFYNDTRRANKSSIAFNLKYDDKNYLFLGDANMSVITKSLKDEKIDRLDAELVKLSHHGSKKNTNQKLLDIVSSHKFIISTNGDTHNHPDKEALSRIIKNPKRDNQEIEFWFNHEEDSYPKIFTDEELESKKYNFKLKFSEEEGIEYEL